MKKAEKGEKYRRIYHKPAIDSLHYHILIFWQT